MTLKSETEKSEKKEWKDKEKEEDLRLISFPCYHFPRFLLCPYFLNCAFDSEGACDTFKSIGSNIDTTANTLSDWNDTYIYIRANTSANHQSAPHALPPLYENKPSPVLTWKLKLAVTSKQNEGERFLSHNADFFCEHFWLNTDCDSAADWDLQLSVSIPSCQNHTQSTAVSGLGGKTISTWLFWFYPPPFFFFLKKMTSYPSKRSVQVVQAPVRCLVTSCY